jgi:aminoglycoside phosphotransferase (APT) family kinase protein
MPKQWEADIQFSEQDVFILIGQQFPALAPIRIKMLGTGWDNVAFLVNERLVFRFPRRLIAASLLKREVRMLPLLAPHLPVQIPIPEYVGYPTDTYPYVFAGYPLLAGITACRCFCSHDERVALAVPIARFLSALHHIPVDSATLQWPPRDDIARADVGGRAATVKERLSANVAGYDTSTVEALISLVDTLATTLGSR